MLSKIRVLAILFVAGLLLPQVAVQAQDGNDDGMSIPQRFEQFGRSLYGGYRPKQNQRQSRNAQMDRQAQQQQQQAQQRTNSRAAEAFDDDVVDDGVAPRSSAPQQVAQRPGQPASKRRVVADPAMAHAPPLAQKRTPAAERRVHHPPTVCRAWPALRILRSMTPIFRRRSKSRHFPSRSWFAAPVPASASRRSPAQNFRRQAINVQARAEELRRGSPRVMSW